MVAVRAVAVLVPATSLGWLIFCATSTTLNFMLYPMQYRVTQLRRIESRRYKKVDLIASQLQAFNLYVVSVM